MKSSTEVDPDRPDLLRNDLLDIPRPTSADPHDRRTEDVLRLQTLADERGLTVEKVQKREDSSTEKALEMLF